MLDIQFIRENQELVQKAATDKGSSVSIAELVSLDDKRRSQIAQADTLRQQRNEHAKSMKQGRPSEEQIAKGKELKEQIATVEAELASINETYSKLLYEIPNVPSHDTPVGSSEDDNQVLRQCGTKPNFDFEPKPHWELTNYIDQERAARISGARFAFIQGLVAKLEMALMYWGMQQLSDPEVIAGIISDAGLDIDPKPFTAMLPPVMMRTEAYKATGRLKPNDVTFKLADDDLWLIGSAEHSLCAYYKGETLEHEQLPIRFVGYSPAFRREVGSAGADTRGILRVHQFNKLEMESFTDEETSRAEHEFMIAVQEYLMAQLGLPYQVVLKCTFDMGGPNQRGVDIETWMPGQQKYRETHSADLMGDYQARGLQTKYKDADGNKKVAYTNDATAIADRTLIAIIENYQQPDGTIAIPEVLQPLM